MIASYEISEALFSLLEEEGYTVYNEDLPEEDAPCPHIHIESIDSSDTLYKSGLTGDCSIMVHVWHNRIDQKKELFTLMNNVKAKASMIKATENYKVVLRSVDENFLYDTTTSTPYLHGVVILSYLFS